MSEELLKAAEKCFFQADRVWYYSDITTEETFQCLEVLYADPYKASSDNEVSIWFLLLCAEALR